MARIRAIQARGLLEYLGRQAKASSIPLIDALTAAQDTHLTPSYRSGRLYVGTSGNGQSASFAIPQTYTSDYTPQLIAEQLQEFVEIYRDCVGGYGGRVAPIFSASDSIDLQIAEMENEDRLQEVNSRRYDLTGLRCPFGVPQQG